MLGEGLLYGAWGRFIVWCLSCDFHPSYLTGILGSIYGRDEI